MDIRGLKEVLERVETKIAVVKKIHVAISFVYWETVLAVLYMLLMLININPIEYVAYWAGAIVIYHFLWKRTKAVFSTYSPISYMIRALIVATVVSIPLFGCINRLFSFRYATSISILYIISVYLFIIGLTIRMRTGKFPKEILPAMLCFAFTPLVLMARDPLYFTGFVVIVTYNVTALLCLMSAVGVLSD